MRHLTSTTLVLATALIAAPLGSAAFAKSFGDNAQALAGDSVYGSDGYMIGYVLGALDNGAGHISDINVAVDSGGTVHLPRSAFTINKGEARVNAKLTAAQMEQAGFIDRLIES